MCGSISLLGLKEENKEGTLTFQLKFMQALIHRNSVVFYDDSSLFSCFLPSIVQSFFFVSDRHNIFHC